MGIGGSDGFLQSRTIIRSTACEPRIDVKTDERIIVVRIAPCPDSGLLCIQAYTIRDLTIGAPARTYPIAFITDPFVVCATTATKPMKRLGLSLWPGPDAPDPRERKVPAHPWRCDPVGWHQRQHALVKEGWCWWYRKYAPGNTVPEGLEKKARENRKGLWTDPQLVSPWGWRKRKER